MYRVLHVMGCSDVGGISAVVLNYYKHLDRDKIHFDIALKTDNIGRNGKALAELGAKVYFLPLKSKGVRKYEKALSEILMEEKYDAVHIHEGMTSYVALKVAKKCGISQRIAHSHTSAPCFNIRSELIRCSGQLLNFHFATNIVGCGKLAGERVFGKRKMNTSKAMVLPNAIDTLKFSFNEEIREKKRNELNISSKYVIGMVGRLSEEKNHLFALDILREVHKIIPETVLLIVGDGDERDRIYKRILENGMQEYAFLLGKRFDIAELNQAFDVCIMPSIHEGFPVAAVEAMASGLPILLSDTITDELSFGTGVKYLPLEFNEKWVQELVILRNDCKRKLRQNEVKEHGLDIEDAVKKLEDLYLNFEK